MSRALVILPGAGWSAASRSANLGFRRFLDHRLDRSLDRHLDDHRLDRFRERRPQILWMEDQPWDGIDAYGQLIEAGIDPKSDLVIVAFSAGVVGAWVLQQLWPGGAAVIAVDGWCVPLGLGIRRGSRSINPVVRLSHDLVTHWNGVGFGAGQAQFYADPFVSHLQLWGEPELVGGWGKQSTDPLPVRITAAEFLQGQILELMTEDPIT